MGRPRQCVTNTKHRKCFCFFSQFNFNTVLLEFSLKASFFSSAVLHSTYRPYVSTCFCFLLLWMDGWMDDLIEAEIPSRSSGGICKVT